MNRTAQYRKLVAVTVAVLDSSETFIQNFVVSSTFPDRLVIVVQLDW